MTTYDRVLARCRWIDGCLVWQGALDGTGYGKLWVDGRLEQTHRVVYRHVHGPIPKGLQLDHVRARGCWSKACCNVAHLEAVTQRVNLLRGDTVVAKNAAKTHCDAGHPLVAGNLDPYSLAHGQRRCCTCRNTWQRRRRAERRAA